MIVPAIFYIEETKRKFIKTIYSDSGMFYFFENFNIYTFDIDQNESRKMQYISYVENEVRGYMEARVDHINSIVTDLYFISFDEKMLSQTAKDGLCFLHLLLIKRGFRKIIFKTISGNPAMHLFYGHLSKREGLIKSIGVINEYKKMRDNKFYDLMIFD